MTDQATRARVADERPGPVPLPRRADGIQLIGEMTGSGYRVPPALARRADGQTVQLTPLLYAVLESLDGRDADAVASAVSERTGRTVSPDNVATLAAKLTPLGLVTGADGAEPDLPRSNPLLALKLKVAVSDPERTRRLTSPFAALFHPLVAVPVLAGFLAVSTWVLLVKGLASAAHEAFARPGLLLLVLAVTILSAGFHEFGHAAATRRGGATPGVMGAGIYLVWPAFYTDVTDSYRLGRWGRLRTDLGGLYFNAIVAVLTWAVWRASGYDALLLLIATQLLQMLRQLLPFVRFDGYHVLADLTGVPDLFQRIGPTLAALVPWKRTPASVKALKPWARAVVTTWVLVVIPVLLYALGLLVLALPRLVGTALAAARQQREAMAAAFGGGDLIDTAARFCAMVIVVLPILAIAVLLTRLVRRLVVGAWRGTRGRPLRRSLAAVTALAVVAGLAWAWWPDADRYRPIRAWERGALADATAAVLPADPASLRVGTRGVGTIVTPAGSRLPTQDEPQLAMVLVPTAGSEGAASASASGDGAGQDDDGAPADDAGETGTAGDDTWIFSFDRPPVPDADDNQALAVATTDGATSYTVAFALIWADGDQPVQTDNSAYALASCTDCSAVAVAFQVVLVVGENTTLAPQNVSVAATEDCVRCLTYSLAVQLFATLDAPLGDDATTRIEEIWAEVVTFGGDLGSTPLSEIQAQLSDFERQILAVVEEDQGPGSPNGTDTGTDTGTDPGTGTGEEEPGEGASPTGDPSESSTGDGRDDADQTESGSADDDADSDGEPDQTTDEPSASPSGSPSGEPSPAAPASPSPSGSAPARGTASPSASPTSAGG